MATRDIDKERHQIETELNVEILPGTEIMIDVGSHHFVKSGDRSHRVLVPQPGDSPHDPLNWSLWWKVSAITAATWVTFTQGFGPLAIAPQFPYYMKDFNATLAQVVQFTGVLILVVGFSNFLWVPIATAFGRRPVYIFSQIITMASMIWRARATTYNSFMGACVLNGIGAGPAETTQPTVIADIFFLHSRGRWNTMYWVAYMGSIMVGPIVSGPMAQHVGWRSFWWLNVGMIGLSNLMVIFMFPETKWDRATPKELSPGAGSTDKVDKKSGEATAVENSPGEKVVGANIEHVPTQQPPATTGEEGLTREETAARDPYLGKGWPSRQQWMPFQPNRNPLRSILLDLWIPWKMFAFPIVEFASFVVSWSCSSFLTINLTQSQALGAPPYNWSAQAVGFTNWAILIGAAIGLSTAGPLSDWVADRMTRKNGGIREPEMRLLAMIPYVIIMYLGNIIVAVGYQHHWPWEAIVVIGFACAGLQVAALPGMASTYAVDSYKPVTGSLFVAITVNKNVWGYGFSKFITPWSEKDGFIPPIMTNASLILLWCLCGILFYFYGKTFRRWSRNSSVHTM